jgi:hypothetical protein
MFSIILKIWNRVDIESIKYRISNNLKNKRDDQINN